jgi:hypothetical protein
MRQRWRCGVGIFKRPFRDAVVGSVAYPALKRRAIVRRRYAAQRKAHPALLVQLFDSQKITFS